MEQILKQIGWNQLFPETLKRLSFFRDGFREYFNEVQISNEDLDKCIVYSFGIYGQGMVYEIYCKLKDELNPDKKMKDVVGNFVNAFEVSLPESTVKVIKPNHYIELFIELLYSFVIKGQ